MNTYVFTFIHFLPVFFFSIPIVYIKTFLKLCSFCLGENKSSQIDRKIMEIKEILNNKNINELMLFLNLLYSS
jgi:hypothetical protein